MTVSTLEKEKLGAAERLLGLTLLDTWFIEKRIRHDDAISGSSRSACYRATATDGRVGFVKAFDFRHEELSGDTNYLERMVREFNYERNVHYYCRDRGISRITRIFEAGKVIVDKEAVHFIICEWADQCLREQQPPGDTNISVSDRLMSLRDTAASLAQLHEIGVAHQDIKPSNAVCSATGTIVLTDLGSSSCEVVEAAPHDLQSFSGQINYAPYELIYEQPPSGFKTRQYGCDLFLMGNLCFTSFVGVSLSCAALHTIPQQFRHTEFAGNYSEVIPHLLEAHELLIPALLQEKVPDEIRADLIALISCLCHPDPTLRGHGKNVRLKFNQFGLERVISTLDLLSKKAQFIVR